MSIWRTRAWLPFQQKPEGWGSCDGLLLWRSKECDSTRPYTLCGNCTWDRVTRKNWRRHRPVTKWSVGSTSRISPRSLSFYLRRPAVDSSEWWFAEHSPLRRIESQPVFSPICLPSVTHKGLEVKRSISTLLSNIKTNRSSAVFQLEKTKHDGCAQTVSASIDLLVQFKSKHQFRSDRFRSTNRRCLRQRTAGWTIGSEWSGGKSRTGRCAIGEQTETSPCRKWWQWKRRWHDSLHEQ